MAAARFLLAAARCGLMFAVEEVRGEAAAGIRRAPGHPPTPSTPRKGSPRHPATWVGQRGDWERALASLFFHEQVLGLNLAFGAVLVLVFYPCARWGLQHGRHSKIQQRGEAVTVTESDSSHCHWGRFWVRNGANGGEKSQPDPSVSHCIPAVSPRSCVAAHRGDLESWNHGIIKVGEDLSDHQGQPSTQHPHAC